MTAAREVAERESLLLRGALDICVLALLEREPLHAYALARRLAEHGFTQTGYGTVYPLVTRLRRQGLLDQRAESGGAGPARNVLTPTAAGRAALGRWREQWQVTTDRISDVLDPPSPTSSEEDPHAG